VTLEPMRPQDLPAVLAIERASFPSAWSEESYLRELRNPSSHYLVARADGQVVGYAGMWVVADEAHVSTIAVAAQRRRCGLGKRLMLALMATAQAQGATRMTLEVREGNTAAQTLYARLGFQTTGLIHRYYGDTGENALVMCRQLGDS
jgi:ribosomal-protein-alanine N-acetyltransferase